ncbi:MAG TPA: hypothetical protein VGR45_07575 [Stellaceae bacterium]|nr:hypothetical protein [Stellaceae bacterium]
MRPLLGRKDVLDVTAHPARAAFLRAIYGGIGRRALGTLELCSSPRRSINAKFALLQQTVTAQAPLAGLRRSSTAPSWLQSWARHG